MEEENDEIIKRIQKTTEEILEFSKSKDYSPAEFLSAICLILAAQESKMSIDELRELESNRIRQISLMRQKD